MEQVIEGAGVPLHDGRAAVNQFLHLLPVLRAYDGFMAALKDFPFLTGNDVIGIGADSLLVRPADKMCALVKRVPQDMANPCAPPRIIIHVTFRIAFYPCDGDFILHQLFGYPHTPPAV